MREPRHTWRDGDADGDVDGGAEMMARIVGATRPIRPRAGWRQEVWEQIDMPPRRSLGLALAAAISFATVMAVSWLPVWAADRAADRTEAAAWAERWAVHDDIVKVVGERRAWEEEKAAIVEELARNEAERQAVIADLEPARERAHPARRTEDVRRAKPSSIAPKGCGGDDPLCGL